MGKQVTCPKSYNACVQLEGSAFLYIYVFYKKKLNMRVWKKVKIFKHRAAPLCLANRVCLDNKKQRRETQICNQKKCAYFNVIFTNAHRLVVLAVAATFNPTICIHFANISFVEAFREEEKKIIFKWRYLS